MRRKPGPFITKTAFLLFSVVFTLAILEVGLRIVLGRQVDYDRVYWKYHPVIGHVHPPNLNIEIPFPEHPDGYFVLRTNNHGLREDRDSSYERKSDITRIVVLGDSHTDGTVNNWETYPNVFENLIDERGGNVEVLNAGVSGYTQLHEFLWFHQYGHKFNPDIVIVGFYLGNDLAQLNDFEDIFVREDGTVVLDGNPLIGKNRTVRQWFDDNLNRSYLYYIAWKGFQGVSGEDNISIEEKSFNVCRGCYWQNLNQAYQFHSGSVDIEASLDRLEQILILLKKDVSQIDAELKILLIPTKRQVEGDHMDDLKFNQAAEILNLPAEKQNMDDLVLQEILSLCDQNNIEALNLLPELKKDYHESKNSLYYDTDWHLNPAGHSAIARYLYDSSIRFSSLNWGNQD